MSNPELHKAADAEEILAGFASRDRGILSQVYEDLFPLIRNMILKNAGQEADALDIFQEAMVIVYEKAVNGEMQIRHSFKSYFYGLCRLQWLMKLRKQKQMPVAFTDVFTDQEDPVELAQQQEQHQQYQLMRKALTQLGQDCQEILQAFWRGASLRAIAQQRGLTEAYAKKRKFTCQKQLIQAVEQHPDFQELKPG